MKKTIFTLALAAFVSLGVFAAKPTDSRSIVVNDTYTCVAVTGSHKFHFETGPAGDPITVIGHPTDIDNLEVFVKNDRLHITFRDGYRSKTNKRVEVYAKNPVLSEATVTGSGSVNISGGLDNNDTWLSVTGSGRVDIRGDLKSANANLSVAGSGRINIEGTIISDNASLIVTGLGRISPARIDSEDIKVSVAGSGSVVCESVNTRSVSGGVTGSGSARLSGSATTLNAAVSGSGSFRAEGLQTLNANVGTTGSGSVHVRCSGTLKASTAGRGSIYYYGNPTKIDYVGKPQRLVKR